MNTENTESAESAVCSTCATRDIAHTIEIGLHFCTECGEFINYGETNIVTVYLPQGTQVNFIPEKSTTIQIQQPTGVAITQPRKIKAVTLDRVKIGIPIGSTVSSKSSLGLYNLESNGITQNTDTIVRKCSPTIFEFDIPAGTHYVLTRKDGSPKDIESNVTTQPRKVEVCIAYLSVVVPEGTPCYDGSFMFTFRKDTDCEIKSLS
jgi:hypothetical protein